MRWTPPLWNGLKILIHILARFLTAVGLGITRPNLGANWSSSLTSSPLRKKVCLLSHQLFPKLRSHSNKWNLLTCGPKPIWRLWPITFGLGFIYEFQRTFWSFCLAGSKQVPNLLRRFPRWMAPVTNHIGSTWSNIVLWWTNLVFAVFLPIIWRNP